MNIPQCIGRYQLGEIAEVHRGRRDVRPCRRFERGDDGRSLGVGSDLVVKALNQLPSRAKPPRELRKELLHFVPARECRIGARLAVVIAEPLISAKEPDSILNGGTADTFREVLVLRASVAASLVACPEILSADALAGV